MRGPRKEQLPDAPSFGRSLGCQSSEEVITVQPFVVGVQMVEDSSAMDG